MDLFRLILPTIVGSAIFLVLMWVIAYYLKKNIEEDSKPYVYKVARILSIIIAVFIIIYMIKIASINEIPRSTIDTSATDQWKESFEARTKRNASQPKVIDPQPTDSLTTQKTNN